MINLNASYSIPLIDNGNIGEIRNLVMSQDGNTIAYCDYSDDNPFDIFVIKKENGSWGTTQNIQSTPYATDPVIKVLQINKTGDMISYSSETNKKIHILTENSGVWTETTTFTITGTLTSGFGMSDNGTYISCIVNNQLHTYIYNGTSWSGPVTETSKGYDAVSLRVLDTGYVYVANKGSTKIILAKFNGPDNGYSAYDAAPTEFNKNFMEVSSDGKVITSYDTNANAIIFRYGGSNIYPKSGTSITNQIVIAMNDDATKLITRSTTNPKLFTIYEMTQSTFSYTISSTETISTSGFTMSAIMDGSGNNYALYQSGNDTLNVYGPLQDSDGDGVPDDQDAFPTNPSETQDTDGDGVGDSADVFPTNPSETQDTDGDGVGDSADVFPTNPSETQDTDGDGVGDSADAFPTNPSETQDTDGDGVGDSADVFPTNPSETQDTDEGGVGDNQDQFPSDDTKSSPYLAYSSNAFTTTKTSSYGRTTNISSDGKTTLITDYQADSGKGMADVYVYNEANKSWEQKGETIMGTEVNGRLGFNNNAIAGDGDTVSFHFLPFGGSGGTFRVFRFMEFTDGMVGNYYAGNDIFATHEEKAVITPSFAEPVVGEYYWTQIGGDIIIANFSYNTIGDGVKLTADGNRLVAANMDGTNGGSFQVFDYDNINDTWSETTNYNGTHKRFGSSIDINHDGSVIVLGAYEGTDPSNTNEKTGTVSIFRYNITTNVWDEEKFLSGVDEDEWFGSKIGLDNSGNTLVVGSPKAKDPSGNLLNVGAATIYKYNGTEWLQKGERIYGEFTESLNKQDGLTKNGCKIGKHGDRVYASVETNSNNTFKAIRIYDWVKFTESMIDQYNYSNTSNDDTEKLVIRTPNFEEPNVGDSYWTEIIHELSLTPVGNPIIFDVAKISGDRLIVGQPNNNQALLYDIVEYKDSDGDGVYDFEDAFPNDSTETVDADGDGLGDNQADPYPGDKDNDGVPDGQDAFPNDASESKDTDGDGVGDSADAFPYDKDNDGVDDINDAFPDDPSESKDTDGDGVGDSADVFPTDASESKDTDGDGIGDSADAFPDDPSESKDTDGDGVGDSADAFPYDKDNDGVPDTQDEFPDDPSESKDTDGDGVGDSADAFPYDKDDDGVPDGEDAFPTDASESKDSDGDGIGDNADAFPNDATESKDSDADGIGDSADAFPNDATESKDSDGDGIGDNADAFPNDPTESKDTDGDGVGDNAQKLQEESKAVFDAAAALDVNDASFNIDEVMTNVITTISAELIATQPIVKIAEEQKTVMKKLIEKEYNVISLPKTEILVDVASFKGIDAPVKTIINVPTDLIDPVTNKLVNPITTVTKIVDEDLNFDGYSINILKTTNGTDISLIVTNTGLGERTLIIQPTGAQYEYILTDSDNDRIKYQMNITIGSLLVTLKNFSTPEEYYAFIKSAAYQTKKTRSTTYNSNAQAKSMTQIRRGGVTLSQQEMNKTGKHTFGASSVVLKRKLAAIGKAKLYP